MIQDGEEILVQNIHTVLQCCWEEEYIAKEFMEEVVVPIYQEGEVKIGNYKEVTLGRCSARF